MWRDGWDGCLGIAYFNSVLIMFGANNVRRRVEATNKVNFPRHLITFSSICIETVT